jgi:hypothetical protein
MTALTGVLISVDGAYSDLTIEGRVCPVLLAAIGGTPEFAYYGRLGGTAICVIVHETGAVDGLPINRLATRLVEYVRGGLLSYSLRGPVAVMSYDRQTEQLLPLSSSHRSLLVEAAMHEAEEGQA